MGGSGSKEDDSDSFVYDRRYIAWDQAGNLRYGLEHPVERKRQLKEILELDFVDEEEGKRWYIMSSAWVASWLAYVHFARDVAPCPGPCRNDHLIQWDYEQSKYVGRFGLFMAKNDRAGDYRRVSYEVWQKFLEFYPGSGPTIYMEWKQEHKRETGEFDPAMWTIVDAPPPPPDRSNKKKKKKFMKLSIGIKSKQKKAAEKEAAADKEKETLLRTSEESKNGDGMEDAPLSSEASCADPQPRPSTSGISSLMTKAEPKAVSLTANYQKVGVNAEKDKDNKPRFSVEPTGSDKDNLATRRESFFKDVYFKE